LLVGALTAAAALLAACSDGPSPVGPLGNPASWGGGLQCTPGKTLADGFYNLQNSSGQTVTVTRVRLIGGEGQRKTSRAWLVPIWHTRGDSDILGLNYWPVRWPTWKYRRRIPATIAPRADVNLVFAQTRTSDHPRSATVRVYYTAGGSSYMLTEPVRVLVAVRCF
jgi:hypothetical protein